MIATVAAEAPERGSPLAAAEAARSPGEPEAEHDGGNGRAGEAHGAGTTMRARTAYSPMARRDGQPMNLAICAKGCLSIRTAMRVAEA
jgi:hypothetical protein